jgi:hypothetical protein
MLERAKTFHAFDRVANVVGIPEEEALSENGLQKCLHE